MAYTPDWSLCGLTVAGDCGPLTIYTDKHFRKVAFPRSPPKQPASAIQIWQRDRWRVALANYHLLTEADRQNLDRCCHRLSLQMNAASLWLNLWFQPTDSLRQTLQRQSGLPLPDPGPYFP
jgi:hypothetical protein